MTDSYVAISRYDFKTSSFPITHVQYEFLKALQKTESIRDSLDYVADKLEIAKEKVHESWKNQIRNQWIANHFFVDRDFV